MKFTATLIGSLILALTVLAFPSRTVAQTLVDPHGAEGTAGATPFSLWNFLSPSPELFPSGSAAAVSSELTGVVRALASAGSDLYAAGDFLVAGEQVVSFVARWNGAEWSPLGDFPQGVDGPTMALAVDGDKVYVGGNFTQAGAIRTRNIAVWDRTTGAWSALGGGVGGTLRNGVSAIAVHDGQVYVGGSFIAAGTTVAAYIARWDGRRWHRVGTGMNNAVNSLLIDGDYLYAGGDFTLAGDVPAGGIARYNLNNGKWENVGVDIPGSVTAVAADDRYLYVGGVFDSLDGQLVNNIVRIEKSTGEWSPLYKGLPAYSYVYGGSTQIKAVEDIVVHNGQVYVGGTLTQAPVPSPSGQGVLSVTGVTRWDGQTWTNFDPNADPDSRFQSFHGVTKNAPAPANVYALTFYKGDTLVIGGDFVGLQNVGISLEYSPYIAVLDPEGHYHIFGTGSANKWPGDLPSTSVTPAQEEPAPLVPGSIEHRNEIRRNLLQTQEESGANASLAAAPDDIYWQPVGPNSSTDNGVLALASDKNEVYAGGTFVNIFGVEANGIAVRRNREWYPLDDGTAIGVDGFVFALVLSGSKLYVGGQFSRVGGVEAHNIAVWDRTTRTWSALGEGVTGDGESPAFVSEILVQGNDVYVAGNFTAAGGNSALNIARWRNGSWSPLGSGIEGTVNALEYFRGNLYAGGSFTKVGDTVSNGVAYWNGTAWKAMREGVNGYVNDLEVYYSFPGDTALVIGGEFTVRVDTLISYYGVLDNRGRVVGAREVTYAGEDFGRSIVLWNGSGWRLFQSESEDEGSGCFSSEPIRMKDGVIRKMHADGTNLYVCGSFDDAFPRGSGAVGNPLNNVTYFNRKIYSSFILPLWYPLQGGVNATVNALTISGDEIVLGGDFTRAAYGNMEADHVAIWNKKEQEWIWAGNPTALAPVEALAMHNNTLYAAGSFLSQDIGLFDITNYLARLTQLGWRTVEGPVQGTPFVLASAPGDELISGGTILSTDGKISVNVARWNSSQGEWNPLTPGSGVASLEDISFVTALAADDDNIFVGGDFDIADTFTVRNVARWERATQTWHPLADGLNGAVYALALDDNGTLYAGGTFSKSGATALNRIARWDGSAWQPLGEGLNGNVLSLAFHNGTLYVGGNFTAAGGAPAMNVARYDVASQSWSNLGDGLTAEFEPRVTALAVINGQVFAAGKFDRSGPDTMLNIARWNPNGWWNPLGSGVDALVTSLAPDPAGGLYAGGYFLSAGNKSSRYVGVWTNVTLSVGNEPTSGAERMLAEGTPNPFNAGATVNLKVPQGKSGVIRLELFDATGRKLRILADGPLAPGEHTFGIEGTGLPAGVYVLRMQSGETVESVRLVKW